MNILNKAICCSKIYKGNGVLIMEIEKKKRKLRDNWFVELISEFSFTLFIEVVLSIVWNVILFIPRLLLRFLSNLN
ncbi:hypothetical protein QWY22_02995 [Planococcus liqunii]|uniref:hypothetical protein n=1 Tax=Planococcus liqunii TaxID=3058394 RepID=UPI0026323B3A|nr:hypothetical protein [Planococcus sp. N056]WKA51583.1 hypothetical protein QWY22_02995 [Planococcus sp. N056]